MEILFVLFSVYFIFTFIVFYNLYISYKEKCDKIKELKDDISYKQTTIKKYVEKLVKVEREMKKMMFEKNIVLEERECIFIIGGKKYKIKVNNIDIHKTTLKKDIEVYGIIIEERDFEDENKDN